MRSSARGLSLLAAAALVAGAWNCAPGGAESSGPAGPEQAFSAQLHVHGSFSEWIGSIDSHSYEASELGLDVLWWSDHDFRATSYRQPSRYGFDAAEEPFEEDERWPPLDRGGVKSSRRFTVQRPARGSSELVSDAVHEGAASLRVTAVGDPGLDRPSEFLVRPAASRTGFRRPLAADVTVHVAIRPDGRPGGRTVVEIGLSEHAPREGLGLVPYRLRYVEGETERRREGATCVLPLALEPGEWNEVALPVTRDAVAGFPFVHGEDNSLVHVALGVQVPPGVQKEVWFDSFRIEQRTSGSALFERQRDLIDEVAAGYPSLRELQGVEVSYVTAHLNEFTTETHLQDYDALAVEVRERFGSDALDEATRYLSFDETTRYLSRRVVEDIHARDGLVSYNHMFGTTAPGSDAKSNRRETLDSLAAEQLFGADLLEVGYRDRGGHDLSDHLWVWDRLARRSLYPVGIGVSDSHGGREDRWRTSPNNFVSWIWAASTERADLITGLRAGRVFFGDLVLFDGALDLVTAEGHRMGQIVVTDAREVNVTLRLEGAQREDRVHVIRSGERVRTLVVGGPRFEQTYGCELDPERSTLVRFEVYRGERAVVFSNPIHFVREVPDDARVAGRVVRR